MSSKASFYEDPTVPKLNVGCGTNILPKEMGWSNLDKHNHEGVDVVYDLEHAEGVQLMLKENTFGVILASHVLEHVKNILPAMQELHRICRPDGRLIVRVPYGSSDIAFEDPTHVRQFFLNSFMYFGQPAYARADYGYRGDWQVVERMLILDKDLDRAAVPKDPEQQLAFLRTFWNVVEEFIVILRPVKPIRAPGGKPDLSPIRIGFREELEKIA